ncbi:hypothetical protein MHYP_G00234450 [Metynnis hypsauchen]
MEINRGCATLPNIHLAYHPTITPRDMYDRLHLHTDRVRIFAKTLKDAALGCNTAAGFTTLLLLDSSDHLPSTCPATPPIAPHIPAAPRPPTKKEKLKASPVRRPPSQQRPQSYAAVAAQPPFTLSYSPTSSYNRARRDKTDAVHPVHKTAAEVKAFPPHADTPTHCPSGYCEVIVLSLKLSTVQRGLEESWCGTEETCSATFQLKHLGNHIVG